MVETFLRRLRGFTFLTIASMTLTTGCQSSGTATPIGEAVPDEPLLIATAAFRSADQYFLQYQRDDQVSVTPTRNPLG